MNQVKISVPDWCYYSKLGPEADYYATLQRLGVGAVEMVDPKRYAAARAAGLAILNLSGPGMKEGLNRMEHHAVLVPKIRGAIQQAADHDVPLVILFSGNREGQSDAEGIANCCRGLEQLLPFAERHRVVLGFEMLCTANHPDYQACHGSYGFQLCERLPSPWLKLVYDLYHMSREGDDVTADVVGHLDCIAHLHLAESPNRSAPRADGNIPYGKIAPAILQAGYASYWGLEYSPGSEPLKELERSIAMLRAAAEAVSGQGRSTPAHRPLCR